MESYGEEMDPKLMEMLAANLRYSHNTTGIVGIVGLLQL